MRKLPNALRGNMYRIFITVMLVIIGIQILLTYSLQDADSAAVFFGTVLPVLFMLGFYYCSLRGRIILSLILFLSLWLPAAVYGYTAMPEVLRGFGGWFMGNGEWMEEYVGGYQFITLLFISLILCGLAVCADRFRMLRWFLGAGLLVYLIICLVQDQECSKVNVAAILFYCIACIVEFIQANEESDGKPGGEQVGKRSVVCLFPFIAFYMLLVLMIPADHKPYGWDFAKSIWEQLEKANLVISQRWGRDTGEGFGLHFAGFSDSANVGGNITNRDRNQMTIRITGDLRNNLYLTGKVYDTFLENEWLNTYTEEIKDYSLDFLETMYAVNRYSSNNTIDYVRPISISIAYRGLTSSYLFSPIKTYRIDMRDTGTEFQRRGGELTFDKIQGYGTEYILWFLQMNLGYSGFYEMARQESFYHYEGEEDQLSSVINNYLPDMRTENIKDIRTALLSQSENNRRIYLNETKISEEVSAYVSEITDGCTDGFERLLAIEKELKQYSYTTNPGKIPEGVDFLDYFLLERKEGYCTYFATAFVLLARAEGFPARYVQGYCVPVRRDSNYTNWNNDLEIVVSSDMAHAWPEVYVDGVGWIPFEPTPSFGEVRYRPWRTITHTSQDDSRPNTELRPVIKEDEQESEELFQEEELEVTIRYDLVVGFLLILLVSGSLVFLGDYLIRKYRYGKWDLPRKLFAEVNTNIRLLGILGFVLQEGETLSELCNRVIQSGKLTQEPLVFITLFEDIRYGGKEVEKGMYSKVLADKGMLFNAIKKESRLKYLWFRLKLGG